MRISDWSSDVCSSDLHQPRITIEHTVAEDTEAERHRVYGAFDKTREQIDRMTSQAEFGVDGAHREVLEPYKMFAYDEDWPRRITEEIDSGLTAAPAIERVQQRTRMRMAHIEARPNPLPTPTKE